MNAAGRPRSATSSSSLRCISESAPAAGWPHTSGADVGLAHPKRAWQRDEYANRCSGRSDDAVTLTVIGRPRAPRTLATTRLVRASTYAVTLPPETNTSGPSFRDWGAANWWQNTRLAYGSMLLPGDYDSLTTIFDYYLQMVPLLSRRTDALFNHSGLFTTETKTLWGLYDPCDYGDNATVRATAAALGATGVLPPAYQNNTYLRYDFGGDAGLTELSLMVLDWYEHTEDDDGMRRYLPLLVGTLDFFAQHYGVVAATGTLLLFPTQALDTYQCPFSWPPSLATCPANDHPTVAALHVLTERALALPEGLTTAAQRDQWRQLRSSLPAVPLVQEGGTTVVSPYETYPLPGVPRSNVETPELYSTHPSATSASAARAPRARPERVARVPRELDATDVPLRR